MKCPGQDERFWKPGDIFEVKCPGCGNFVEFFKDEPGRKCRACGRRVNNPKIDLGCAKWCLHGPQCLASFGEDATAAMCEQLIARMKMQFGSDTRRIDHALAVLNYADEIQRSEGGDPLVIKAAAILHDIGIQQAEQKYGSASGKYQEIEGPPIARRIMADLHIQEDVVDHVCTIVANHHSAVNIDTTEFRIVWDADWLVNVPDEFADPAAATRRIDVIFRTETGRRMARRFFADITEFRVANSKQPSPRKENGNDV
jgi:putative nucleotidyltransferase with HDIG domain